MDRGKQAPTGPVVDAEGTRRWFEDGLLHREDGPAVKASDGTVNGIVTASSTVTTADSSSSKAAGW